jgi:hypothetical protein
VKVILQQEVKKLGKKGDVLEVSEGYARNYLLPHKFAIPATADNVNAAQQQKDSEARKVLRRLIGTDGVDLRIERIKETLRHETKPSWRDLRGPALGLLPIVWVGIGLSVFQQFVGINVIFYYSNVLWQAVGFSEADSFKITVITAVVNIATTLIAIASVDRYGRKPLLIIGSIGMTLTLATMAVIFGTASTTTAADGTITPELTGAQGPVALVAANLFVVPSACRGGRWSGCCWGRSSRTASGPRPCPWLPLPSGSPTG